MFFYEGQSCPVCNRRFAETDDIVSCPICGAPHHRACWQQTGHCHFEDKHGTDEQWKREDTAQSHAADTSVNTPPKAPTQPCPSCGHPNSPFAEQCAHCGNPLTARQWQSTPPNAANTAHRGYGEYSPFVSPVDPLGGIAKTEMIEDLPVEEVAKTVEVNTRYYIPRMWHMSRTGKRVSWNWIAFLLPSSWLLYRRNLLTGTLVTITMAVRQILSFVLMYRCLGLGNTSTYAEMMQAVQYAMQNETTRLFVMMIALTALMEIVVRVLCGMFGNWLYAQNVLRKTRKRLNDPESADSIVNRRGVSMALGLGSYLVLWFVQMVLTYWGI